MSHSPLRALVDRLRGQAVRCRYQRLRHPRGSPEALEAIGRSIGLVQAADEIEAMLRDTEGTGT